MKDSEQAQHALDFLSHVEDVATGGMYAEFNKGRELTVLEKNVQTAALNTLMRYFVAFPESAEEKPKRKRKASKKPSSKGATP